MAFTYAELYEFASVGTARTIENTRKILILNMAQTMIWNGFDWRWTIGSIYPFWLMPYEQEYGPPIVALPSDCARLQRFNLVRVNPSGPTPSRIELKVVRELPLNDLLGPPRQVSLIRQTYPSGLSTDIQGSTGLRLRFWPRPGGGLSAPNYLIEGTYKKRPPSIDINTYQVSTVSSEDSQVQMWLDAIRAAYAKATGDPSAGDTRYTNGQIVYTGKMATAMASISEEARSEGLNQSDANIAPTEGLIPGLDITSYGPFPFL